LCVTKTALHTLLGRHRESTVFRLLGGRKKLKHKLVESIQRHSRKKKRAHMLSRRKIKGERAGVKKTLGLLICLGERSGINPVVLKTSIKQFPLFSAWEQGKVQGNSCSGVLQIGKRGKITVRGQALGEGRKRK